MTDIKAKTISDSVGAHSPRLFTAETRAPTMIHQEVLRHRRIITEEGLSVLGLGWEPDFSYSVSSTRAVPFAKLLQECRDPELAAAPVHWGRAQRGMVPGEEIDDEDECIFWPDLFHRMSIDLSYPVDAEWITRREAAKRIWTLHGLMSSVMAEVMVDVCDPHKSIPNRMMAPHTHYNVLMTGTEPGWLNFFGLRLDGAADPIVRALAEAIWIEWNESMPRVLKPGEWALPYADDEQSFEEVATYRHVVSGGRAIAPDNIALALLQKMSVARCAHLSYTSFETGERMTVEQCLKLYQRLVEAIPIHASPTEHQATPDTVNHYVHSESNPEWNRIAWNHPNLAGNLGLGWIQLRKLLPNEAVAPMPGAYR